MPAVAITAVSIPKTGLNLTDQAFTTLASGSGNGVSFSYQSNRVLCLKNDSGGSAVFTIKLTNPPGYTEIGATVPNPTITVANNKTHLVSLDELMQAPGTTTITVECDVAGKAVLLQLA